MEFCATGSRNLSRLRENNALKSLGADPAERGKHWDVKLAAYSSRAVRVSFPLHSSDSILARQVPSTRRPAVDREST